MEEPDLSQDLSCWLILMRTPGMSPAAITRLVSHFGGPRGLLEADRALLFELGLKARTVEYFKRPDRQKIESDLAWLAKPGNTFVSFQDAHYPPLLRNIPDPPAGLFVRGRADVLKLGQLAIVGSRKPTPGGKRTALEFASRLGKCGLVITSGLALGVDAAAHEGALLSNSQTIAVSANGLDTVYPGSHTRLAEAICANGAMVSEFPTMTRPLPGYFPRRNRIISGMAVGTLVVEATIRSGSLITARLAMEQGREVFAIPGSIYNPVAAGCHKLISDGAKLTADIEDILEEIGPLYSLIPGCEPGLEKQESSNERLDEEHKLLLDNIGYEPVTVDQLIAQTGIPAHKISGYLLELELRGRIETLPGARFTRI